MATDEEKIKRKIDDLNERSDQVKDILGQPPNWVIQWGISVVFFIVILVLIGAAVISYNDIIPARITITSKNPPVYLETRSSGKLTNIFVNAGDEVKKDQILAVVENTANLNDVQLLKSKLESFSPKLTDFDSLKYSFPSSKRLGQIQSAYSAFRSQYQEYLNYNTFNPEKNQVANLRLQVSSARNRLANSRNQLKLFRDELENGKIDFSRYQTLFDKGSISAQEFQAQKSKYSVAKRNFESLESQIRTAENSILVLENNIRQASIGDKSSLLSSDQNLEEAKQNLENQIYQWEQLYVIKSPIEGGVTLFDVWNEYQNVKAGDILFTIVPNDINGIIGRVTMPVQNSGKVEEGQNVIIKLDNYPYQEWGSLEGTISSISEVPKQGDQMYTIFIDMDGLVTSFDKELDFKQEMQGTAEIVVEELTILQRVFYQLREVFNRKVE